MYRFGKQDIGSHIDAQLELEEGTSQEKKRAGSKLRELPMVSDDTTGTLGVEE
jgi:hypothetical protein